jgi:hypothetical protein
MALLVHLVLLALVVTAEQVSLDRQAYLELPVDLAVPAAMP